MLIDPRPRSYAPDDPLAPVFGAGEFVAPDGGFRNGLRERLMIAPAGALPTEAPGSGAAPAPSGSAAFPWQAVLGTAVLGVAVLGVVLMNRPSSEVAPPPAAPGPGSPPLIQNLGFASPTPAAPPDEPRSGAARGEGLQVVPPASPVTEPAPRGVGVPIQGIATGPAAPPPASAPPTEQAPVQPPPRDSEPPAASATPSPAPTAAEPGEPPPVPPTPTPGPSPVPRPTTLAPPASQAAVHQ